MWPLKQPKGLGETSRRREERFRAEWLPCSLGQVLDLSGFGAKIRTTAFPPPAVGDELKISFRHSQEPVTVVARVVRVVRLGSRSEVAVEFVDVQPAARAILHGLARGGAP